LGKSVHAAQITRSGALLTGGQLIIITAHIGGYLRIGRGPAPVAERDQISARWPGRRSCLAWW
jgi:hypothetical protein